MARPEKIAQFTFRCDCCEETYPVTEAQARGECPIDCPTEGCGFRALNPRPVQDLADDLSGV